MLRYYSNAYVLVVVIDLSSLPKVRTHRYPYRNTQKDYILYLLTSLPFCTITSWQENWAKQKLLLPVVRRKTL